MSQIRTEGIRPDRPPVPSMPEEMRGRPCVYGHIINSKNIDFFRKQHPDMEEWSYDEPKMLIIAASHGPYTPFSATVYDEDGNEAICLNYVDYRRKIPGVRPDRRLPTDIMRQIEKNLGIGPEVQPKWHPCYRTRDEALDKTTPRIVHMLNPDGVFLLDSMLMFLCTSVIAARRPTRNGDIVLIAVTGPFWMWALATSTQLRGLYSSLGTDELIEEVCGQKDDDGADELEDVIPDESPLGQPVHMLSLLREPMTARHIFTHIRMSTELSWSDVMMLDTFYSEDTLKKMAVELVRICKKKA